MDEATITQYITDTFEDVEVQDQPEYGYRFFFYRDERMLPFATLALADNEHERVSQLDRPGVYRLNIGVSRPTFEGLFGAGGAAVDTSGYDYAALDVLMPHPDYAAQSFLCVLNPSGATLEQVKSLLAEAHELAAQRYARKAR